MTTLNTIIEEEKEAQKTNEEIVEETFDEYVNYWSGSPKGKTHRVGLTKQELAFVLTLKDEAHKKEMEEAYRNGRRSFLKDITKINHSANGQQVSYIVYDEAGTVDWDKVNEALPPTKEVTEELLELEK